MKKNRLLWIIVFLSVAVRIIYYIAQPDLSTDHISQMAMTQNFMDGHGFSFEHLDSSQNIYYKTHIQWPPLYPLLLALVTFITSNMLLSSLIIQIFILLFFIIIWRGIFNLLKSDISDEGFFYFVSLLIVSTSILNNINTILIFALLVLSVSLYFTFSYLFSKQSVVSLFLSSFFASLLFWTHYSYFFVAFFPSVVLLILFISVKDKRYIYDSVKSFSISLFVTSSVLLYNYLSTGFINYMDNPEIWNAGFFPEHLLLTDPFFLNAFFKTEYFFDYLFKTDQYLFFNLLFQFISLLIFILMIWFVLKLKKINILPFERILKILLPFSVIIVLTLSFLLYFTLHYNEIPRPGWTHIGDPRYMSAVYLSIIAIVVLMVFVRTQSISLKTINLFKTIFIALIFISLTINIYITYKEWGNYTFKTGSYTMSNNDLQELYSNIKLELAEGKVPVFIDSDLTVRSFRISQYAGAAVINSNDFLKIDKLSSKLVFFFIMPDKNNTRKKDIRLLEWAGKFNLTIAGSVYNNLTLYRVKNL